MLTVWERICAEPLDMQVYWTEEHAGLWVMLTVIFSPWWCIVHAMGEGI